MGRRGYFHEGTEIALNFEFESCVADLLRIMQDQFLFYLREKQLF